MNHKVENLKGKLIVSCQALPEEPLHSSFIMGRMALAAKEGGASGIRANTKEDIKEIQSQIDLPIIGIVKRDYADSDIYITPTMKEIDELMEVKPEIIAMDATISKRPGNKTLDEFFHEVKEKYPDQLWMADCSTVEEALHADELLSLIHILRNCTPFGARHIAVIKAFPSSAEITSAVPFSVLTRN